MKRLFFLLLISIQISLFGHGQDSLFKNETPCRWCNESETSLEVGMVFSPTMDGYITHLKFYKFKNDNGNYQLNLYDFNGNKIASKNLTTTATGWQRVKLDNKIPVIAGNNYIVSYFSPNGNYSGKQNVFNTSIISEFLIASASNLVNGNGRYVYASRSTFPTYVWNGAWYYTDVIFEVANSGPPEPPPTDTSELKVNAGIDQNEILSLDSCGLPKPFISIKLNGEISGDEVSFMWKGEGYSSGDIKPSITITSAGKYIFILKATDIRGNEKSDSVTVNIKANPKDVVEEKLRDGTIRTKDNSQPTPVPPVNIPPQADAGNNIQVTLPVNSVTIIGKGTDEDGNIIGYKWMLGNFVVSNTATLSVINLTAGSYTYTLIVTDNDGASDDDNVTITVKDATPIPNQAPTVTSGGDKEITLPVSSVIISGMGYDSDGTVEGYAWSKISGPNSYSYTSQFSSTTTITNLVSGDYVFRLTATDNNGAGGYADIKVKVNPEPSTPPSGTPVQFSLNQISGNYNRYQSSAEYWYNGWQVNIPGIKGQDRYYRFNWAGLNPGQGQYNWTLFDQQVNTCIDNGQGFSFGIMAEYPGGNGSANIANFGGAASAYPEWVHNAMQKESVKDYIYQGDWIPNWNSPSFLDAMEAFNKAVYQHLITTTYKGILYKNVINWVDIRGYGSFGEWHSYPQGNHAGTDPTAASLIRMIDIHKIAYPDLQLQMMVDGLDKGGWSSIPAEVSYKLLTDANEFGEFGIRRDSWGATEAWYNGDLWENNPGSYNGQQFKTLIMNKWKNAPITGEPCCNSGYADLPNQVTKYHVTSFGNGNYGAVTDANVVKASNLAGPKISISSGSVIANSGSIFITTTWVNNGNSGIYKNNWIVVYELKSGNNVFKTFTSSMVMKGFLPGTKTITDNFSGISSGTYTLTVKIIDKNGYFNPYYLGLQGRSSDGSYPLAQITL